MGKIIMMSIGLLSAVMILMAYAPLMADFILYEAPLMWSYLCSFFTPPFLYVLINSIIVIIAASSKLQTTSEEVSETKPDFQLEFMVNIGGDSVGLKEARVAESRGLEEDEEEFVISRSLWMPPVKELDLADKPPTSARFRSPKPSPEGGRSLGVSKSKRNETLEGTWKTITDATRHLRKSDTFNNVSANERCPQFTNKKIMQKSETFGCDENGSPNVMRGEASLSQDELNRRVEAFINKFNEEMRLQRQESLKKYKRIVTASAR